MRMHDGLVRARVTAGGKNHPVTGGMIETAENLRREPAIGRDEQDRLALESHRRAVSAQSRACSLRRSFPSRYEAAGARRSSSSMSTRARTSLSRNWRRSKPSGTRTRKPPSPPATPAVSPPPRHFVWSHREAAERQGLTLLVRLTSWSLAGVQPKVIGIGPVPSTAGALEVGRLKLAEIDVIELNEAFAVQALAVMLEWKFGDRDLERTDVHGSGLSMGNPVGATGARMLGTMALGSLIDSMAVSVL